jgi:hypothetical protein
MKGAEPLLPAELRTLPRAETLASVRERRNTKTAVYHVYRMTRCLIGLATMRDRPQAVSTTVTARRSVDTH